MSSNESKPKCPLHGDMQPATRWIEVDGKPFGVPIHICSHAGCLQVFDAIHGHQVLPEETAIGNPLTRAIQGMKFLGR
jgi:hypothetical protein